MSEPNPPDNKTRVSPPRAPNPETLKPETTGNWSDAGQSASRAAPPARLGRFEIRQVLGEGAFGRVYLAFDPELERQVAIKVPHRDGLTPAFRERFLREARATAAIHHPNVCPVYEVGTDGDVPYIVMHFVVGGTLAGLLDKLEAPLPPRHALAIARKLALGMAAAHAQGVIHRDLKPANVLFDKATREVLITDFGLARIASGPRKTADGSVFGTPAYMSPEQARGKVDDVGPHSDVYSLGVILYRMLTGDVPFHGSVFEVMVQHWETPPRPPSSVRPGLDSKLDTIVLMAMAKAPADRHPSAKAFANALTEYLKTGEEAKPVPPTPSATGLPYEVVEPSVSAPVVKAPGSRARLPYEVVDDSTAPLSLTDDEEMPPRTNPRPRSRWPRRLALGLLLLVGAGAGAYALRGPVLTSDGPDPANPQAADLKAGDVCALKFGDPEVEMRFRWVPAGSFTMGTNEGFSSNKPAHRVKISKGFWMAETEVTQTQWKMVAGTNPSEVKGENLPVESVTWNDADKFCKALSTLTGKSVVLPTEAQ